MDTILLAGHASHPERFAIYVTGKVRWLGPAEYAHYQSKQVQEISTSDDAEYLRWVAQSQTLLLQLA